MDKHTLRNELKARRKALSSVFVSKASMQITERALAYLQGDLIACYIGVRNEVDTRLLIQKCLALGKRICLPKVCRATMQFYEIHSFSDLEIGSFHLLEPKTDCRLVDVGEIDCMVMPLVGFNEQCQRIGQGGGYYDRLLETQAVLKIGLAYECQKSAFTKEAHDIDCDWIISEKTVYKHP